MDPSDPPFAAQAPTNWRQALLALVVSRCGLIELESKAAVRALVRRLILAACCAICVVFAWVMLLAGAIAAVAATSGVAWGWIALTAAALHLAAAVLLGRAAFAKPSPAFPATRAEFIKDRQWLESIQNPESNR